MPTHELYITEQISEIVQPTPKRCGEIGIIFSYRPYLAAATKEAEDFVTKLIAQKAGGDIKIKGLRLVWEEDDESKT